MGMTIRLIIIIVVGITVSLTSLPRRLLCVDIVREDRRPSEHA